jgi:hypothetical protein
MRPVTFENILYLVAFLLAFGVRFLNLGAAPLSDFEAGWALQSFFAAQGDQVVIGPNPGYFSLTSILFFISESSNALARFWPAFVGSILVVAPFGLRTLLGRKAALIAAFGLAFDPGLTILSRQAGGSMMAVGFGAVALVLIWNRKLIWAGVFGGLALISGPWVMTGLIGAGISYGIGRFTGIIDRLAAPAKAESPPISRDDIRLGLLLGGGVILVVSTLFFRFPGGIGAWSNSFVNYLSGWGQFSSVPVFRPVSALLFYQPLAFLFAVVAVFRGWLGGNRMIKGLSIWFAMTLLLPLVYPNREVMDAVWSLVPIWVLAGYELQRYLSLPGSWSAAFGQASVSFILLVVMWLVGLRLPVEGPVWLIFIIIPILIILTTILVGLGWSQPAAQAGLAWGLSSALGLYCLAAMFGATQTHPGSPVELWAPDPAPAQANLLVDTLGDLALNYSGHDKELDIVVVLESPALQWAVRKFSNVRVVKTISPDLSTTVILLPENEGDLSQTKPYRGQDFVWNGYRDWEGALPPQWFQWVTARDAPVWYDKLVLWARADLFPAEPKTETQVVDPAVDVIDPNLDDEGIEKE